MIKTKHFVYILLCNDQTYYIGKTTNIKKRIKEHNISKRNGAKYTRARRPVVLKYFEEHPTNLSAVRREIELKKLPREKKIQLVTRVLVE